MKRFLVGSVSSVIAATAVGPSFAQIGIEEITVTARKRAENLQDIPLSIAAFSAESLKDLVIVPH